MRSVLWLGLALGLTLPSCGGKKGGNAENPYTSIEDVADITPGSFVEIDFSDDDDEFGDLAGAELMTVTASCGDLVKLEPSALLGKLVDAEIRCLDGSLRDAERQTVKNKISRVLMADAWAKADRHRWEAIVRRHVTEIDRSDPDLCYKFSLHLSKQGPDHVDETLRWADVALDNKQKWQGDMFVSRVYNLYRLKALSANSKWNALESSYLKEPSQELLDTKDETRNLTKTLSREWLEYARSSGRDDTVALQLCISAAGSTEFCEQG